MKNRFDYLSRRIGEAALAASGTSVSGDVIHTEPQYADLRHAPDLARHAERAGLGLLGQLAAEPCLFGERPDRTADEKEFIVAMQRSWEDARTEGRSEGRTEGRAEAVLTVLRFRGLTVSDGARQRIQAERDPEQLKRWLEKAIVATSISDVLDEPS